MSNTKPLSSSITIAHQFQKSANVSADFGTSEAIKGFVLNGSGQACLETISRFLSNTKQRAFTWTGPYGTGKSSLALFLATLLGGSEEDRQFCQNKLFSQQDLLTPNFSGLLSIEKTWKVLTLTGHNASLIDDFSKIVGLRKGNSRKAIEKFITLTDKQPSLLLIDELGKYLEGGNSENCYFLQELAEAVNRCDNPVIVVGILHQSFSAYASSLSNLQQEEWSKVQGRFIDIPLLMSPNETLQLLSQSIEKKDITVPFCITPLVKASLKCINYPINKGSFEKYLKGTWPLNPITSLLLGPISRRRFLQNTRSVFSFLTSKEPYSFNLFLENTSIEDTKAVYNLDQLWDYLQSNYGQSILSSRIESHRWLVACDCIDRAERLHSKEVTSVIKSIAVLDLFHQGSGLEVNLDTITLGLFPLSKVEVTSALQTLIANKIIIEKRYANAYGLFEGSDFNLEAAVQTTLAEHHPLDSSSLQTLLEIPPLIANRHYAVSGTLRWFSVELSTLSNLENYLKTQGQKNLTGRLILCINDTGEIVDSDKLTTILKKSQDRLIFVGLPENSSEIFSFANELQALSQIAKAPSLEGDTTGRKELQSRTDWVIEQLKSKILEAFNCIDWFNLDGLVRQIKKYSDINRMISDCCDAVFYRAPVLNNELINREQLSSNITSARKRLILNMIDHSGDERLGFQGFPPEAMIYASLLKNKFHRKIQKSNTWKFVQPELSSSFYSIWKATDQYLKSNKQVPLTDLYLLWSKPPFGLKSGFMPILAMAYFLANQKNISIYFDGVFQSDIKDNVLDHWTIDPKSISFRYVEINQNVSELLSNLSTALTEFSSEKVEPNPLVIARALVKEVLRCPQWAMRTTQLSKETKLFRDTVLKAWDPLKLIFDDLPSVFNSHDIGTIIERSISALSEIRSITPKMLDQIRKEFLTSIDSNGDFDQLAQRAEAIANEAPNIQLKAFIGRVKLLKTNNASDIAIEGLIALATSKPKKQWTDHDINQALQKIREWCFEFRHMEGLSAMRNLSSQRYMIGLVVAGQSGRSDIELDVPKSIPKKLLAIDASMNELIKNLSDKEALLLLIEHTSKVLNRMKKNG